jgi:hypothetical protein
MLDKITAHDQSSQHDTKAILDEGSTYITCFNNVPKALFVFAFSIVFSLQIFNSGNNMHLTHSLALLGSPLTRSPVCNIYFPID